MIEPGRVVEYFENNKLIHGVVINDHGGKLKIITHTNREESVPEGRILMQGQLLPLELKRDEKVVALEKIRDKRSALENELKIEELWDLVRDENAAFSAAELADFCYSGKITPDHKAAVFHFLQRHKIYFAYKDKKFISNSEDKVRQSLEASKTQKQEEEFVASMSGWIGDIWAGKQVDRPDGSEKVLLWLKDYAVFGDKSKYRKKIEPLFRLSGIRDYNAPFKLMVKLGEWGQDENLLLYKFNIQTGFNKEIKGSVKQFGAVCGIGDKSFNDRPDAVAKDVSVITIDGTLTKDFDDALSIEDFSDYYRVGIHISDVAELVPAGSPIDIEAMSRVTSIYLPETKIPMMPQEISEGLCSLKQNELRHAVSVFVDLDKDGNVLNYNIRETVVTVTRRLTYGEVVSLVNQDVDITNLYVLAKKLRRKRFANNAMVLNIPEIKIWIDQETGEISVNKINGNSLSQLIVSEFMILANHLIARFLNSKKIPCIFRTQEPPVKTIIKPGEVDLLLNYLQRKNLSRVILMTSAYPHSFLGLNAYTTATSPIRRYSDLVTQRQLKAVLNGDPSVYTEKEIQEIIYSITEPQANAMLIRRHRVKYWILKYLESKVGEATPAIVLYHISNKYYVLLTDYIIEASISDDTGALRMEQGDHLRLKIQSVNAREDKIKLIL